MAVTALVCAEHHSGYGKPQDKHKEPPKAVATGSNVFNLGLSQKGKGETGVRNIAVNNYESLLSKAGHF